jgi:hypothetical protein
MTRAANLWHMERFPWHKAFTAVPVFLFLLSKQCVYIVKNVCIKTHISHCIEIADELQLLPNNTESETFLHKLEAVQC